MPDVVTVVFATTSLLALVSLLLPLAGRLVVPFAVLLALVGVALGGLVALAHGGALGGGMLYHLVEILGSLSLSSEAFLYIFLPTLLFETALNVDVSRMFDEIATILLLAVVAVMISTFVVGLSLWPVTTVGLPACLLLGAILATTDPVAVVAIFDDIGAPARLSTLVEGESLFNDAAAIAAFTLLIGLITGHGSAALSSGVALFLRDFVGGLALGGLSGWAVCALLPLLRGHGLAEVTLTIAVAYLSFVVGDHYVQVSGVVAAVSAGLVLSHQGRRRLSPSSWDRLSEAWEQLGFWASSLIFLLAAMLVPRLLQNLQWGDVALLGIVVVSAFLARALTLFGLLPILSRLGWAEPTLASHKLVILWGGMRGAVSLALALAVTENEALPPEIRRFVAILATGFVLWTLLVNAPTLRIVMHLLKLDRLSPEETALRDRALALSREEVADGIARLMADDSLPGDGGGRGVWIPPPLGEPSFDLPEPAKLYSGLRILTEREQELCLEQFEKHTVSRHALSDLLTRSARLIDSIKDGGGVEAYNAAASANLRFSLPFRAALTLQRWFSLERPLARRLANRLEMLFTLRLVLVQLLTFSDAKVRPLLGDATADSLGDALEIRVEETERAIAAIELQYPTYAQLLSRQIIGLSALRLEEESHRRLREESIISQELYNNLQRDLSARRQSAEVRASLDLGLDRSQLVERVAAFRTLELAKVRSISRLLRPQLTIPDECVVRKGDHGDGMYFISSGAVEVHLPSRRVRLGTGDFFGEMALLTEGPRSADVTALGFCQLLFLSKRDFQRLLDQDDQLRDQIREVAAERLRAG